MVYNVLVKTLGGFDYLATLDSDSLDGQHPDAFIGEVVRATVFDNRTGFPHEFDATLIETKGAMR